MPLRAKIAPSALATPAAHSSSPAKPPTVAARPVSDNGSGIHATLLRTINPPFILEEHSVDERLPIKAIVVGAGITGVTAGVLLPVKVPELSLAIYGRHSDIGGAWHSNTYPGVRCDVPYELLPLVLPDFAPNCRRLTPGPGYLEALTEENVEYNRTPIASVSESGVDTADRKHRPVDAIICATGADVTDTPGFPIINGAGDNLQASWHGGGNPGYPDTYLGMAAPSFPNLLFIGGPNSASGFAGTVPYISYPLITSQNTVFLPAE
ncbi:hypothetical protein BDV10DRAFT_189562 [Aspergillus recurvatus]